MKYSKFKKWLEETGVDIKNGKKHYKLYYKGRQTTMPRHPGEMSEKLRLEIIKQLGIT